MARKPRNSLASLGGLNTYQVSGLKETFAALDQLSQAAGQQALVQAMRAAMRPVRTRARQLAPKSVPDIDPKLQPGLLGKAVAVVVTKGRKGLVYGKVGIVRGKFRREAGVRTRGKEKGQPWYQDPARYVHLVEFGSRRSRKYPFLRPAWDEKRGEAIEALRKKVSDVIAKWSKQGKLGRKLRGF